MKVKMEVSSVVGQRAECKQTYLHASISLRLARTYSQCNMNQSQISQDIQSM